jgi:hypothetical protein
MRWLKLHAFLEVNPSPVGGHKTKMRNRPLLIDVDSIRGFYFPHTDPESNKRHDNYVLILEGGIMLEVQPSSELDQFAMNLEKK